jgi:hypothetical protein
MKSLAKSATAIRMMALPIMLSCRHATAVAAAGVMVRSQIIKANGEPVNSIT